MADDGLPSKTPTTSNHNRDESDNEEGERPQQLRLDLGDNSLRKSNRLGISNNIAPGSSSSDIQKREDNPFSFKHFLRDSNSYQSKGARPKVFCEGRPVPPAPELGNQITSEVKSNRVVPEFSSALPDFVQDHLVIEQCYLGNNSNQNFNLDINNLPDFAPSRDDNRLNYEASHNNELKIPLDLPVRPPSSFPLDLPISNSVPASRNCPPAEVGNSKSLPDFLADSAVCSQICDNALNHTPENESDLMRRELESLRRQLSDQIRRADNLSRELEVARSKEHEYTHNLAKALEQVEENLEKSNRKAAASVSTIQKLKQEIKLLNFQINELKRENSMLRGEEAAGGAGYYNTNELQSQRLAQELRAAASTAEHSLRQLLTGVDNLRIMAASLENMHRIEEKNDPFIDKDESGPAL